MVALKRVSIRQTNRKYSIISARAALNDQIGTHAHDLAEASTKARILDALALRDSIPTFRIDVCQRRAI
jgi:hypothetical protein